MAPAAVWLIAIVIIAANSGFWATYLFTPYASEVFLLSVAMGGLIGVLRNWINPVAPFISGFVADRFGISTTTTVMLFVMMICFALFAIASIIAGIGVVAGWLLIRNKAERER